MKVNKFLSRLGPFKWSLHNILGHPLMEIFNLLGFKKAGSWIHDTTMPDHDPDAGRG